MDRLRPPSSPQGPRRQKGGRGVPTGWLWVLSLAILSVCYGWFVILPLKQKLTASVAHSDALDDQVETLSARLRAAEAQPQARTACGTEPVAGLALARDQVVEELSERLQDALDRGLVTLRPEEDRVVMTFMAPLTHLAAHWDAVAEVLVPHAPMARLHLEVSRWAGPAKKPQRRLLPEARPWLLRILADAEAAWSTPGLRWDVALAEEPLPPGDLRLIIAMSG